MAYFPMFIDLQDADCLVVGGGQVALRKVQILLEYGARIRVVALQADEKIQDLASQERICLALRPFQKEDTEGASLVIAASSSQEVNLQAAKVCREKNIPVNVVDVKEACTFIFPALVKEGDITVGISTGGSSPALARLLKEKIRGAIPAGLGTAAAWLGSRRGELKKQIPNPQIREAVFKEMALQVFHKGEALSSQEEGKILETMKSPSLVIGTRRSELALCQTNLAAQELKHYAPELQIRLETFHTMGDRILEKPLQEFGGKGVFVTELEQAIQSGRMDLAVHSAKDMPMDLMEGLAIVGVLKREDPRDVLVTMAEGAFEKKETVLIGTSSPRRKLQIQSLGPVLGKSEIQCENLRGNVQTRLRKLEEGQFDGIILAAAGLKRLNLLKDPRYHFRFLDCSQMIPAGGQGILALEGRPQSLAARLCAQISCPEAWTCLKVERQVLKLLGAGCHEPIGVYCQVQGEKLHLEGICERAGKVYRVHLEGKKGEEEQLAREAAKGLIGE